MTREDIQVQNDERQQVEAGFDPDCPQHWLRLRRGDFVDGCECIWRMRGQQLDLPFGQAGEQ